jgi:hypothetical protein
MFAISLQYAAEMSIKMNYFTEALAYAEKALVFAKRKNLPLEELGVTRPRLRMHRWAWVTCRTRL